jgi:signal transduction histidine kinase
LENIAAKEGWELEYVPGTLEEGLARLDNGTIDILPAIPYTPEMAQRYTLTSEALLRDWGEVYTYKGSGIDSMRSLEGRRIAYCDDIFFHNFNVSLGNSSSNYVFLKASDYRVVFEMVSNRDADAGIIARSYARIHEDRYDIDRIALVISPTDMVFALPKNADPEIPGVIDKNIRQIPVENQTTHYMPETGLQVTQEAELTTWESPSWLKFSAGMGIGLLLLFVVLSLTLRNKVEEKTSELNFKNRELEIEIRERKTAEEKLKKYSLELKHSNELKDLFTDILRHDLINPATVIKGYVEYLIEGEKEERRRTALQAIERNNLKLISLIENAAHLAKLENLEELEFETADLKKVIEEVIDNLKPKLDEKKMKIVFCPEGEYPADLHSTIEDVFSNLIGNSIKYSPQESKISIDIKDLTDSWEVSITDEGEGIPDKEKPYIFDRFKRAHKVNVKGSGLGLAIVKRVIELHDGTVEVRDGPEASGTTFAVTLQKTKL